MTLDLSVFEKFDFEYQPVGMKILLTKPCGYRLLDKTLAFCEMVKEAQKEGAFYTNKESHNCMMGPYLLGMIENDAIMESGHIGPKLGTHSDPRANRRVYDQMYRLTCGTVNYVLFAPLDQIDFQPDILIVVAKPAQAEVILRAKGFYDGSGWNAKGTTIGGCNYMFMYPYVTGELNMMVSGLHHGMRARNVYPEGLLFLSIPFNLLPGIIAALNEMVWDLPQYTWGKETHLARMREIVLSVEKELYEAGND